MDAASINLINEATGHKADNVVDLTEFAVATGFVNAERSSTPAVPVVTSVRSEPTQETAEPVNSQRAAAVAEEPKENLVATRPGQERCVVDEEDDTFYDIMSIFNRKA